METEKKQSIKDQITDGTAPNQQKVIFRIKEKAQHFNVNCTDPKQIEQRIYDAKPELQDKPKYFNEAKNFGIQLRKSNFNLGFQGSPNQVLHFADVPDGEKCLTDRRA